MQEKYFIDSTIRTSEPQAAFTKVKDWLFGCPSSESGWPAQLDVMCQNPMQ